MVGIFRLQNPTARAHCPQDLLRLIDLCPFLASEKSRYDDDAVLSLLAHNPRAACLRHPYRCGIGNNNNANNNRGGGGAHPLALVVALGGSLEVVSRMVDANPAALGEKLSGRRNVLHYAIAEGVGVNVIRYLTSRNPSLVAEEDSFQALPLHLACTYCTSSSSAVLLLHLLLDLHPAAATSLDHKLQTPLHRACRSRASMEMVLALIEAYPEALFLDDWHRTRPLEYAESMHQRLSEPMPEVIEVLGMAEDILRMNREDGDRGTTARPPSSSSAESDDDDDAVVVGGGGADRARMILAHFRTIRWWGGIRLAFERNVNLASVLDLPPGVFPRLLRLLGTEGAYSVLVHRPDVVCGFTSK